MTTVYKLTTASFQTRNETQWGEGITLTLPRKERHLLCSKDVFHAYHNPNLAVIMDIVHANYLPNGVLWECNGEIVVNDGTKVGCISLTTLRQIPIPEIRIDQRIKFAIQCAKHVYKDERWNSWANDWLSGKDRSMYAAADAAADATRATADAAAIRTADAIRATSAAAYAANAAADAHTAVIRAASAANAITYAANADADVAFIAEIAAQL